MNNSRRTLKRKHVRSRRFHSLDSKIGTVNGKRESLSSVSTALSSPKANNLQVKEQLGVHLSKKYLIYFDAGVQRYFFKDRNTKEKLWKLKRAEENQTFIFMDKKSQQIHEWQLCFHYILKRYFFYNKDTRSSCWVLPVHSHLVRLNEYRRKISLSEALSCLRSNLSPDLSDDESLTDQALPVLTNSEVILKAKKRTAIRKYNSESLLTAARDNLKKYYFSDNDENSSCWSSESE